MRNLKILSNFAGTMKKVLNNMKMWGQRVLRAQALKYVVVLLGGMFLVGYANENSLWNHLKNLQQIRELNDERDRYESEFRRDQAQIRELDRNPKAIEKIARERYFMKADDEDIFVLSDDDRSAKPLVTHETID